MSKEKEIEDAKLVGFQGFLQDVKSKFTPLNLLIFAGLILVVVMCNKNGIKQEEIPTSYNQEPIQQPVPLQIDRLVSDKDVNEFALHAVIEGDVNKGKEIIRRELLRVIQQAKNESNITKPSDLKKVIVGFVNNYSYKAIVYSEENKIHYEY